MKWLNQLERKFGKYAIPNLMQYLVAGQALVWVVCMFFDWRLAMLLNLTREGLLGLQLWRVVTFVFVPTLTVSLLSVALTLYFYYFIGNALERNWGAVHFNAYYLLGMLGAVVAALLTGSASSATLNYTLFFAFAMLYPEVQLLLFFVLPIKVKWLGWAGAGLLAWQFVQSSWAGRFAILIQLVAFFLFFGSEMLTDFKNHQRRKAWKNQWK